MTGSYRFRPQDRLRSSGDFIRVKNSGRRLRTAHFGVNTLGNGLPHHRLGMVVLKRFWGSVLRNLVKRRLREWFRLNRNRISGPGRDIVIIPRPGAEKLSSTEVDDELNGLFEKEAGRST